jgi:hypothetical protein
MQIHAGSFPGPAVEKNTALSMIYTRKWVIRLTFYGKKKTRLSAIINDNESLKVSNLSFTIVVVYIG